MTTQTTETTALILAGDGYQLTIDPTAERAKAELVERSAGVTSVADNDESYRAQRVVRDLAAMRILVEKSRKEVKEPVLRVGKLIDSTAAAFLAEIDAEERRVRGLIETHAAAVAREKARKEAEERRAADEARRAREAAERAEAERVEAERNKASIAELLAKKAAEKEAQAERVETLAARVEASNEVAATEVAAGIRFALDFEVIDLVTLARAEPELVTIAPKRLEILRALKELEAEGLPAALPGLRVFKRPVVSTR